MNRVDRGPGPTIRRNSGHAARNPSLEAGLAKLPLGSAHHQSAAAPRRYALEVSCEGISRRWPRCSSSTREMCGDPISGSISPNECNDITSHPISSNRILSDKMTVAGRDTTIFRGLRLKSRLVLRGSAVACRSIREHGIFRTVERGDPEQGDAPRTQS